MTIRSVVSTQTASTTELVWTSGSIASELPFTTPPPNLLVPGTLYEWTVSTVSSSGFASPPSAPARFRTSLLGDEPWEDVAWLGSDSLNVYRTTFSIGTEELTDAVLYVCGLGYSTVSVNGEDVPGMRLVTAP